MEKLEEYQSDLGERATRIIIKKLFNFELRKVPQKKNQRTPDYEIIDNDKNIVAICEVKSSVDSPGLDNSGKSLSLEEFNVISQKRDRNHRSKLNKHNNKAMSQLPKNSI